MKQSNEICACSVNSFTISFPLSKNFNNFEEYYKWLELLHNGGFYQKKNRTACIKCTLQIVWLFASFCIKHQLSDVRGRRLFRDLDLCTVFTLRAGHFSLVLFTSLLFNLSSLAYKNR